MKELLEKAEKSVVDIYNSFKHKLDYKIINDMKENFYSGSKHSKDHFFPLIKYIINNKYENNVNFEVTIYEKIYTFETIPKDVDNRIIDTYNLLKNAIKYAIENKITIPNTSLYIWISDRYPWDSNVDKNFPIYLYAKPKNKNFLIFPDNTFNCLTLDKKYDGICYDFDVIKEKILQHCNKDFNDKPELMYFKGTPTTKRTTQLRENLQLFSKETNWLKIHLDAWEKYEKIYEMCNYKYLLNLPGNYPWSNRFKYLFLMKSLVINVNSNMRELNTDNIELNWMSFIDYFVEPNVDYINIDTNYYWSSDSENKKIVDDKNYKETQRIMKELTSIYKNKNNNNNNIIKSGFDKINILSNKHINDYIINCIVENSKIIRE
jgi:hypothetical protein